MIGTRHHLWTDDDTLALIFAVRYALPRMSYAPTAMADLVARRAHFLGQGDRELLIREIERFAREPATWQSALAALRASSDAPASHSEVRSDRD